MPQRRELALTCLFLLILLAGCGTSDNNNGTSNPPAAVTVTVAPATASVVTGATQQFTATVANATNTAVTWQVNGVAGGNATTGTISSGGLYTAPASVPSPAAVTVTAVSQADSTKSGTASVTVTTPPAISVTVAPLTANVAVGATQQFTATVANTSNTAVTWQVNGVAGGSSTVGTISGSGLYTGPVGVPSPAAVTVTAVSSADNTKTGTATVTVTAAPTISVTVTPTAPSVQVNATQQFTATVTGTANTAVTWQVNNVAGGNATVGTISASGLYMAPAAVPNPATVTITAISSADNTKNGTATVTVMAAVTSTAKFAYVSSFPDNVIKIFSVDNTTGLLTSGATSSTGASSNPSFVAMHPSGKFLYSLNKGTNNISIFSVDATTGALTSAGTATTSSGPHYMAFTSDGKFAYVTCDNASALVGFSVNTTTGALTQVAGSPYTVSTGKVRGLAITPDNKFLYAADRDASPSAIFGYTINQTTGALTKMAAPFSGDFIGTLIVEKTGKFLYAGSPDDTNVSGYSINSSTGALTFMNDYPAGTSDTSVWLFDPTGTYLYGGSTASNNVFGFKLNADGSLTSIAGMPVSAATLPNGGGIHPNGKFAYVVSTISETSVTPGTITIYSINATTGAWTQINSTPAGVNNTIGFAITP
jgi:6-phosphogluconolactonase (cycloisomerase 2 family)